MELLVLLSVSSHSRISFAGKPKSERKRRASCRATGGYLDRQRAAVDRSFAHASCQKFGIL